MSPGTSTLWNAVRTARRRVRRDGVLAAVLLVAALAPLVLAVGWALGGLPAWVAPSPAPLLLEVLAGAAAVGGAAWAFRHWIRAFDDAGAAAAAESTLGLPQGAVRGVLELSRAVPEGTSAALYQHAEADVARRMAATSPELLVGEAGARARRRRTRSVLAFSGAVALAAALGFSSPTRSRAGWQPLLHPVANLRPPPLPPMVVRPGDARVARGTALDVRIEAPRRDAVVLHWRAAGNVARERRVDLRSGVGATKLASIEARLSYWVTSPDGTESEHYTVTPVDPLLLSDLKVDVVYPSYLARTPERFEGELPPLEIPAGTELVVRGRATRDLSAATLDGPPGGQRIGFSVAASGFAGRWRPRASGTYRWRLEDRAGGGASDVAAPLEVTVLPDSVPHVEVVVPAADTTLGEDMTQGVAASAWDDHGLRSATLVSWRSSALGGQDAKVEQALPLTGVEDRLALQALLDASDRHLLPGDTLRFFIRVVDNSPARQVGVSRTVSLRLPGMDEIRQQADEAAQSMVRDATSLAESAKAVQEATRDLARQSASSNTRSSGHDGSPGRPQSGGGPGSLDYDRAQKANQVLDQQQAMVDQVEKLQKRTEELRNAMEAAGLQDPELQKRLDELEKLYQQILTPELRQKLQALQQALQQMDAQKVQQALEQLAQDQKQFQDKLEQSLALLRRAAAEQQMNSLAQQARELSRQQEALAQQLKSGDPRPDSSPEPSAEKPEQQPDSARAQEGPKPPVGLKLPIPGRQKTEGGAARKQGDEGGDQKSGAQKNGQGRNARGESKSQGKQEAQGERKDAASAGKRQGDLAARADSLRQAIEQLEQQLSQQGEQEAAKRTDDAGRQTGSAQQAMAQAAREAGQRPDQAARSGEEGAQQLSQAAETLDQTRQAMSDSWKQEVQQAVQQATNEAVSLAQRQATLAKRMKEQQQKGDSSQDGQGEEHRRTESAQLPKPPQLGQQQGQGGGKQGGKPQQNQSGGKQGGQVQSAQEGGQSGGGHSGSQGQQPNGGGQGGGGGSAGGQSSAPQSPAEMRSEQEALKQGLETLGRNLSEAGQRSAMMNREVGAALGRAMLNMQQTLQGMEQKAPGGQQLPVEQAQQTVDALNRLALALATNNQQIAQSQSGTGMQQALEQLSELAKQQGGLNGQTSSLMPLNLGRQTMSQQLQQLAQQQRAIAKKLGGMQNMGGQEDLLGRVDKMAHDADQLAQDLSGGRLTPEILQRQEKLFHRLLDAGRTLERDEVSNKRVAERPGDVGASAGKALDPALLRGGLRYPLPSAAELQALPPAYRRLILEYFDRLNRASAPDSTPAGGQAAPEPPAAASPKERP